MGVRNGASTDVNTTSSTYLSELISLMLLPVWRICRIRVSYVYIVIHVQVQFGICELQYLYVLSRVLPCLYRVDYTNCSPVVTDRLLTSLCELRNMSLQFTKNTLSQIFGYGY